MKKKTVKNNVKKKVVSPLRKELNAANEKIKALEKHRDILLKENQRKDDCMEDDYHEIKYLNDINELKNKAIDGFYTVMSSLQQAVERGNELKDLMEKKSYDRKTRDLLNRATGNCCDREVESDLYL